MPSPDYSPIIQLPKLAEGGVAPDVPWLQLRDRAEAAIAGTVDISMAAGDVNISADDDKLRNRTIRLFGALTANRVLTVALRKRDWTIHNDTTGSFTISVIATSGTGVTVAQKALQTVRCDGANMLHLAVGLVRPMSMADADAPANTVYYSTTASKLVYKDASNNVNALY